MKIGERRNYGDGTWHAEMKIPQRAVKKSLLAEILDASAAVAAVILAVLAGLGICLALALAVFLFY